MPSGSPSASNQARNKVFICYSHQDEKWRKRLQVHLTPLERQGKVDRWDDTRIQTSQNWRAEILRALSATKVAILFVSADFLASEFVQNIELPSLLVAAETDGAFIMPVIVSHCRFADTPKLSVFQAINPELKPLASMGRSNQDKLFTKLSIEIENAISGKMIKT